MLYRVIYWLLEYTKVAFPGQLFLPQRTYTTPPVGSLRLSPEDGSGAEPSEIKCEQNNAANIMHMLPIAYICVLLLQMRTQQHARIEVARHMYTHTSFVQTHFENIHKIYDSL